MFATAFHTNKHVQASSLALYLCLLLPSTPMDVVRCSMVCYGSCLLLTQNKNSKESVDRRCSCRLLYLFHTVLCATVSNGIYHAIDSNLFGGCFYVTVLIMSLDFY